MADIKFTDTLTCTATHGKLAKAEQIYDDTQNKSQGAINSTLLGVTACHVNLGTFTSSGDAERKAATPEYAGNTSVVFMHYSVDSSDSSRNGTGLIVQQVSSSSCFQMIFWDNATKTRTITFTDAQRTSVKNVGDWFDFDPIVSVRNDSQGMANYGDTALLLYVTTIHGNSNKFITIPCVGYNGSQEHGLMLYGDKVALDNIKLVTIDTFSKLEKLTTSSTSDEIITALGMQNESKNALSSVADVKKKLDDCISRGKLIRERNGQYRSINVSFVSSTYVLSLIGSKYVDGGTDTSGNKVWLLKPTLKTFGLAYVAAKGDTAAYFQVTYVSETFNLYTDSEVQQMKSDIAAIKTKLNLTE